MHACKIEVSVELFAVAANNLRSQGTQEWLKIWLWLVNENIIGIDRSRLFSKRERGVLLLNSLFMTSLFIESV